VSDGGNARASAGKADMAGGVARPEPIRAEPVRAEMTALQRALGNRAIGQLVDAAPGIVDGDPRRALRTAALLRRLGADLGLRVGDVEIRVDPEAASRARASGGPGLAQDGAIYLDPAVYDGASPRSVEILAHELVHVAQARSSARRAPVEAVEAEASAIARALAAGQRARRPRLGLAPGQAAAFSEEERPSLTAGSAASLASDPMAAIELARAAFDLPFIGGALRRASTAITSQATSALLSVDPALLDAAARFLAEPDIELRGMVERMRPWADQVPQIARAKAAEYLAPLRALGEPAGKVLDALDAQLDAFAQHWPKVLFDALRSTFFIWEWQEEAKQLAELDQKYEQKVIDRFDYWLGVLKVIVGGIDRVAGFISLAIWLIGLVGGTAVGAGGGGAVGVGVGTAGGVVLGGGTGFVGGGGVGAVPGVALGGGGGAATGGTTGATGGGGVGAVLGGGGGAAIFEAIGGVALVAQFGGEGTTIAKSAFDLATKWQATPEAVAEDYQQIASSLITLAVTIGFQYLGTFASTFASKAAAMVRRLAAKARALATHVPAALAGTTMAAGTILVTKPQRPRKAPVEKAKTNTNENLDEPAVRQDPAAGDETATPEQTQVEEVKPDPTPTPGEEAAKPEPKPSEEAATPEPAAEVVDRPTPEAVPEQTPEAVPEQTPEAVAEQTPEAVAEQTPQAPPPPAPLSDLQRAWDPALAAQFNQRVDALIPVVKDELKATGRLSEPTKDALRQLLRDLKPQTVGGNPAARQLWNDAVAATGTKGKKSKIREHLGRFEHFVEEGRAVEGRLTQLEPPGVSRYPRVIDIATSGIQVMERQFQVADDLARKMRGELESNLGKLQPQTMAELDAFLAELGEAVPQNQVDQLRNNLGKQIQVAKNTKKAQLDAEREAADMGEAVEAELLQLVEDNLFPKYKRLSEMRAHHEPPPFEEPFGQLMDQKRAIAEDVNPSAVALYEDIQAKFRDRARKAGVHIPSEVEFHHLLPKDEFPELALDPRFLVLAPRGGEGERLLHDLIHELSAALSTDHKWEHLNSPLEELIREVLSD
jgi:hypothetical protein